MLVSLVLASPVFDVTQVLQQKQRPRFVGGIVGNGNGDFFRLIIAAGEGKSGGQGQNGSQCQGNNFLPDKNSF